jgi:antitoxin HicB
MNEKSLDYYLSLPYRIIITPDDEGYGIEVPDLPGCYSHAEQWGEIQDMTREAMSVWIGIMLEDGKPVPEPTPQSFPG